MSRLSYFFKRLFKMDWKAMWKTAGLLHERSGKSRIWLLCDMLRCAVKYNAGYVDYKIAQMYKLNDAQRKTVITRGISNSIVRRMNDKAYWHFFDDKKAGMAGGKQKELERGTNEYLFGIEWDVIKRLTISGGAQITDYGLSDNFQSDVSFSCDSYSLGFGAKVMLSEKMALNVGYMWTNYHDYTKKSENYCGTNLPGVNVYSRTNKVFGLSLDYAF